MANIIRENNKFTVSRIKKCFCEEKTKDIYRLVCTIKERGMRDYSFCKGRDFISQYNNERKTLYLSEEALNEVNKAVDDFDIALSEFSKDDLDYRHLADGSYLLMMRKNDTASIIHVYDASELTHKVLCYYDDLNEEKRSLLKLAEKKKDRALSLQLKFYYNLVSDEEAEELKQLLNTKLLPPLGDEYDRYYSVVRDTIDFQLLKDSGYKILHRPYFSMKGSTHKLYSLNPHTRTAVDAAYENSEYITFEDYLKLFYEA